MRSWISRPTPGRDEVGIDEHHARSNRRKGEPDERRLAGTIGSGDEIESQAWFLAVS